MQYVIEAKAINPALRVSIDPGFDIRPCAETAAPAALPCGLHFPEQFGEKESGGNEKELRTLYRNLVCVFC